MEDINDDKIECTGGGIFYQIENLPKAVYRRMSSIEILEKFGEIESDTGFKTPKILIDFIANIED